MTCRDLVAVAVLLASTAARADDPVSGAAPATRDAAGGPEAGDAPDAIDRRLAGRLVKLAEHHYRAGEYYRAISAYEELALFSRDDAVRIAAAIRIAMSYHHGRQLGDALGAYRTALALARDPDLAQGLRIQRAVARAERGLDEPGAEAFDAIAAELVPSTTAGGYRTHGLYQLARIEALAGQRGAADQTDRALRAACLLPTEACRLEPVLARALARPAVGRRSPWLGLGMSLVVPGAGSVYGGHLVDGLYYFAFTTLSGLGALDVHDGARAWTDQKAAFYGLAALAAIFYAGSALQGYVAVARHNEIAELDARRALWRDTDLPLPLDSVAPAP
jgi:hypothetical protein